ncbi:MAG: HNH endonuclease [Streptosporangiaceae bacterium]
MDSELIARISPEHRRRLAWFEEHQGEVSAIPGPLADGLLLVSKPKGIYKPGDLPYALSIRINLDSPYPDGVPVETPGGGWVLSYHQENADPAERDNMFTNRGLMRCIADRVPVGVLRERAPAGRRSQYDVLGLAMPVRWSDGYFFLESLHPKAAPVIDPVSDVLEATARAELDQEAAADSRPPDDDYDARLRVFRQIVARRGQSGFRAALIQAYQGRCAITGCDAAAALEGAHLRSYRGPESNAVTNGLLLRADIHTLFDLRLLAPDPATRNIVVSKLLAGTQYEALSTRRLTDPAAAWQRPSQETLEIIWQDFREAEDDR